MHLTMEPLLRLYPTRWQRRYATEMDALLADDPPGIRARLDLALGALDAHLHPWWVPAWPVIAAAIGGVAWTFAGAVALGQPVPPDWPGGTPPQQIHLDLWVEEFAAAHDRVMSLGAKVLKPAENVDSADNFQVYADPAGHPFCLCWIQGRQKP